MTERKKHAPPLSVRMTLAQKARLKQRADAAGRTMGSFVRKLVFDEAIPEIKERTPRGDMTLIGQLLGKIGASRIPNNLNQLAKAMHSGSLPVTPEVLQSVDAACKEIHEMNQLLHKALKPPSES